MSEFHEQTAERIKPPQSSLSALIMKHRHAIATLGVLGMACVSGLTNSEHGMDAVMHAAINQAIHTGISAAVIMKIHACITKRCSSRMSQILPALIPAAISTAACYAIHKFGIPSLRDPSAEPALASVPTAAALSVVMPTYHLAYYRHKLSGLLAMESHMRQPKESLTDERL